MTTIHTGLFTIRRSIGGSHKTTPYLRQPPLVFAPTQTPLPFNEPANKRQTLANRIPKQIDIGGKMNATLQYIAVNLHLMIFIVVF
ncbi:MAG: hypothetical protein D6732_17535 [Methanobacteriota archaeon]|nr:MAG: hypothetical protein D6732_17535 [Euryarchaeota archaeon]